MLAKAKRLDPHEVFTPRAEDVNPVMYVPRLGLESDFISALEDKRHLVMHGESGSGKSWLYKHIFDKKRLTYRIVNLANASRFGTIEKCFLKQLEAGANAVKAGSSETMLASGNVLFAKADIAHTNNYRTPETDVFEEFLKYISEQASGKPSFLVLDNLESIFENDALLKELADLVTLLDDTQYAKYKVRFLIVGTPQDIKSYFHKTPTTQTVANRLRVIEEVFRFSPDETDQLVKKGFVDLLKLIKLPDNQLQLSDISKHVQWITDNIPQRVHEYCLTLAKTADSALFKDVWDLKVEADRAWLAENLDRAYVAVEASMNEVRTETRRRDQVLFAIGQLDKSTFSYTEVEKKVREEFLESTKEVTLNVNQQLSDLAARANPVIRLNPRKDAYVFADPAFRSCLRVMLRKSPDGKVEKAESGQIARGISSQR
jgi:hypothetical protein